MDIFTVQYFLPLYLCFAYTSALASEILLNMTIELIFSFTMGEKNMILLMRVEIREEFPVSLFSVNALCLCVFLSMLSREIVEIKKYRFDAINH